MAVVGNIAYDLAPLYRTATRKRDSFSQSRMPGFGPAIPNLIATVTNFLSRAQEGAPTATAAFEENQIPILIVTSTTFLSRAQEGAPTATVTG